MRVQKRLGLCSNGQSKHSRLTARSTAAELGSTAVHCAPRTLGQYQEPRPAVPWAVPCDLINQLLTLTRKISALTARTQLGQIMNRAVENNDRFLVKRNGEPTVLILSVADYVKTFAPPPDWLERSWASAKRHVLDKLTMKEVAAARRERRTRKASSESGR